MCDLLVVFDDTAIIWQIKDLKVDENGRYKQAEVEKNLRQLSGARRLLFDIKAPVKLSNPRRGEELFDPSKITKAHLISVLMGEGARCRGAARDAFAGGVMGLTYELDQRNAAAFSLIH